MRAAVFPTDAQQDRFHVLAAIDWQNVGRFAAEIPLGPRSLIVGDPAHGEPPEVFLKSGARYVPLALKKIAAGIPGAWPNMVALGALAALMGIPAEAVEAAARKSMKKELEPGLVALRAAMAEVKGLDDYLLDKPGADSRRWLISGIEAPDG